MPLLVLVLGLGAGSAITALYFQADDSRSAQLEISRLRLDLENLVTGAFRGDPRSGGSPARARRTIAESKTGIAQHVRYLTRDGSAPSELNGLGAAIRRLYPATHELYVIGAFRGGFARSPDTDTLLRVVTLRKEAIVDRLDRSSDDYDVAASRTRVRATVGSAVTLMLLLAAFLVFYQRSVRARRRAEALAAENERLAEISREEATTDELTGLRNRRALNQDFADLSMDADGGPELMLAMFDLDRFKEYNDTFGHGAGDALLARLGRRLARAMGGAATHYRMGGDEFCIVARADSAEGFRLVGAAAEALSATGDGWTIGCSYGVAWIPSQARDLTEALRTADQQMYANKASRSSAREETAAALVQVLAEQGDGLDGHAGAVAELAVLLAEELGMPPHEVQNIGLAAELHDIGKAAIPEAILSKPGPLDDAEWEYVRRHTIIGERIVLAAPALAQVAGVVRSTHERVDGTGYPDGLAGDEIPMGSRIIAVPDAFHAMITDRPYGSAVSEAEAIAELERCAGTQFDAGVVAAFLTVLARRPAAASRAGAIVVARHGRGGR